MSNKRSGIPILLGAIALGGVYYYFTMTKMAYAKIIGKQTERDFRVYMGMDKDYLKARANAIKDKKDTFEVKDKTYVTETGKVKQ